MKSVVISGIYTPQSLPLITDHKIRVVGNKVNTEGERPFLFRMVASHTKYGGRKMRMVKKKGAQCTCKFNFFIDTSVVLDGSSPHCHGEYSAL